MQLHTFKARSLAEALRLVREELGSDASVLHTREIGSPLMRLLCGRMIEVTASPEPCAPSRLPESGERRLSASEVDPARSEIPRAELQDFRRKIRRDLLNEKLGGVSLIEELAQHKFPALSASST
jgi:flagellar biosynthesis GTPase FlhF